MGNQAPFMYVPHFEHMGHCFSLRNSRAGRGLGGEFSRVPGLKKEVSTTESLRLVPVHLGPFKQRHVPGPNPASVVSWSLITGFKGSRIGPQCAYSKANLNTRRFQSVLLLPLPQGEGSSTSISSLLSAQAGLGRALPLGLVTQPQKAGRVDC